MCIEGGIATAQGHQLLMGALLGDLALVHQHDQISTAHSAEPVSDEEHRFVPQLLLQVLAHRGFRVVIEGAGSFVQN